MSRAALAGAVVAGALLRFATLGQQSFEFDEAVTRWLVEKDLGDMLATIPVSEQTPPLYYLVAWPLARVLGSDEWGLRSLSALAGTATIPLAYAAGRTLVSRRAGIVTAVLVAVSPLLVWFSQQARAYSLVVMLAAAALFFFARALRDGRRSDVLAWALLSAAAVATHYFAAFVVLAEAAWLLRRRATRAATAWSAVALGALGVALAALAAEQRCHGEAFGSTPLASRLARVLKQDLLGLTIERGTEEALLAAAAGAAVAATAIVAVRRRRALAPAGPALAVAATGLALPALAALAGFDYVNTRNLIVTVVPLAVVVGAAVAAAPPRAAAALTAAWALVSIASVAVVVARPDLQREDWRGIAASAPADARYALVVTPGYGPLPLLPYADEVRQLPAGGAPVSQVVVAALPVFGEIKVEMPLRRSEAAPRAGGFALAERRDERSHVVLRYRSAAPRVVRPQDLRPLRLDPRQEASTLLVTQGAAAQPGSEEIDLSCEGYRA